jgi:hypothetical protein
MSAAADSKIVLLLLPEAIEDLADPKLLERTLVDRSRSIRVLLCIPSGDDSGRLTFKLDELGVETQVLLGPGAKAPATKAFTLRAPPDMADKELKDLREFALALSDVVLMTPVSEQSSAVKRSLGETVANLGKLTVAPGGRVPDILSITSVTRGLDPDLRDIHAWGPCTAGRLEQFLLEALAYNWSAPDKGSIAESNKRLRRCFGKWRPSAYFAPDAPSPQASWRRLVPDALAADQAAPIVSRCDALDRSAVYGSSIHRDLTWLAHFGAAFAVLFAVWGHLVDDPASLSFSELLALIGVIALVAGARRSGLQERWTACRLAAEQLRIARMSLPLLVLPPALATEDKPPRKTGHSGKEAEHGFNALMEVKRIVREHGLPHLNPALTPAQAAEWLQLIVRDQITYHKRNHRKLEHAEARLVAITQLIFVIAALCVVPHFFFHSPNLKWLLFGTAAAPAFAAALHGTGTRLGIVHRAALSLDAEAALNKISTSLEDLVKAGPGANDIDAWRRVRRLAFEAAEAMGRENSSWHGLVRRYQDVLP